jgi:PIN domain nuclease of toxin-antitoxin system
VKLLLDTHCWLWLLAAPDRLRPDVVALLCDPENDVHLSAASAWEMVIKYALGKLTLAEPPELYIPDRLEARGVSLLPIELRHVLRVAGLPMHHRDPFDRILIAQALADGMQIVTGAHVLTRYGAEVVWATP